MPARRRRKTTTTTTKRATTTRRRRRKRKVLKLKVEPTIAREIWAIIFLALGILTILSLQGAFGVIGDTFVNVFQPILGWGIYVAAPVLIVVSIMLFFSKKVHFGATRTLGVILFMFSLLSIFHLSVPLEQIHEFAAEGRYGGYTGFVSNFLLLEVLGVGQVAAAIIFVAMFLVSLLLLFELPFRELMNLVIPEIKIEKVKTNTKSSRKARGLKSDEEPSEMQQELDFGKIKIHKSTIRKSDAPVVDETIYEEEEDQVPVNQFSAEEEEAVMDSLTQNERATEMSRPEDYEWEFPSLDLLKEGDSNVVVDEKMLVSNAETIKKKLSQFNIEVRMHEVNVGPTVIQYTLKPDEGVKLSKITGLKNDLALAMAAERIRIEAPIPGKSLVGIEVPNEYRAIVHLKEILESAEFTDAKSKLTLPLGRDVAGNPVIANLETMPHLLIAGTTGSGKSVAMNSFLISLLYQNSPKDLKFIMIDPKRVELSSYNSIPHLLTPVIKDPEKAAISLRWVVAEMTRRYNELSSKRVRNIFEYNELKNEDNLPRIVVVIDELADLMMVAGKEVEASICRIAQMARAVGIHLIIATQRPSVDVITGLIKANIPARISFAVSSSIDSRTIIDSVGAEDLLGRGDMLYLPTGMNRPVRVQGIYVSTQEIERVTNRVKLTVEPNYDETITSAETANSSLVGLPSSKVSAATAGSDEDSMYEEAYNLVRDARKASASFLQRRLKVGYARAARLIDLLEANGVVGPPDGAKPRKVNIEG